MLNRIVLNRTDYLHKNDVYINQHLLWYLMSVALGTLTERLVHPTAPVLLTKNGHLALAHSTPDSY